MAIIKKELPDVDLSNLFDKALVKFTGLAIKIEQVAKLESKGNQHRTHSRTGTFQRQDLKHNLVFVICFESNLSIGLH